MNEDSKTPEQNEPQKPHSNASSNGANGAVHAPSLTEDELIKKMVQSSLVPIPAKFRELQQMAVNSDLVLGIVNIFRGSALVTIEVSVQIKKDLSLAIRSTEDPKVKAMLATALAALISSEATAAKVNLADVQTGGKERKGRPSFAKGEKIGPIIDAKRA